MVIRRPGSQRLVYGPILAGLLVTWAAVLAIGAQAAIASPVVDELQPNHGPEAGGTAVTILGSGFTGATAVKFGLLEAESFTVNSDISITAVSPPQGGQWGVANVTVTTPDGTSAVVPQDRFGYGPIVAEMTPASGPAAGGTPVTIGGFGLAGASAVSFGVNPASSFSENPDGSITAVAPPFVAGQTIADVIVSTPEGPSTTYTIPDAEPASFFTYGPTITSVTPSEGAAEGGSVTIHGSGFTSAPVLFRCLCGPFVHRVEFGSTSLDCGSPLGPAQNPCSPVQFTVISDSEIAATVPPGTGTVDLRVVTDGGASPSSSVDRFAYAASGSTPNPLGDSGGKVQLLNCGAVTRTFQSRRRSRPVVRQICAARLVSGSIGSIGDGGGWAARLMRGHLVYAHGIARVGRSRTRMALEPLREVAPGTYKLVLSSGHGTLRQVVAIR